MPADLESAKRNAELIRFSGDRVHHHNFSDTDRTRTIRDAFYKTGLLVSEQTTPTLAKEFASLCDRLSLPRDCMEAFVYASPEIQAECFAGSIDQCTVRFSSALVNLLDEDEFSFVAGHEIGHFLLGHGHASHSGQESIEHFMQMRAQEISVDRCGLIACGDLQTAIRALMKSVSGLGRRFLRFDAATFISQLSRLSSGARGESLANTHPSMIIRCRALLWFSMDNDLSAYPGAIDRRQIDQLDERVSADLNKYVDGPARERIEASKTNLAIWMAAREIIRDGKFERREQEQFRSLFGEKTLQKLTAFLSGLRSDEVKDAVYERVKASREELESVIPQSFEAVIREIESRVNRFF